MYVPPHFAEPRDAELHRIIREHPFGALVTLGPEGLDVNHIPFELDPAAGPAGTLTGHVARANPVWQEVQSGSEVLVIFRGAQGYISPSWYPSKPETHRHVPTWNYEVVHAHGVLTVRDDEKFVRGVVARLTRRHQAGEAVPWKMSDSAPDYIDTLLRAIVGLEIRVTRLVGKRKLGQNREERDRLGAAQALRERGQEPLGQAMDKAMDKTS